MQFLRPEMLEHEQRVAAMMALFNQARPEAPVIPDLVTRTLRARLILEEALEYCEASGLRVSVHCEFSPRLQHTQVLHFDDLRFAAAAQPASLVEMVDGLSDLSVVTTGSFVATGVRMRPMLALVDANNLLKAANGHIDEHGKFIKPKDHPAPDFRAALKLQGYEEAVA